METQAFDVSTDTVDLWNNIHHVYNFFWDIMASRDDVYMRDVEHAWQRAFSGKDMPQWRDGSPSYVEDHYPVLGVDNGSLYMRWTRSFYPIYEMRQVVAAPVNGDPIPNDEEHTKSLTFECPRVFGQFIKGTMDDTRWEYSQYGVPTHYRSYRDNLRAQVIFAHYYSSSAIRVPMRERLGAFLMDKLGLNLRQVDALISRIWASLAALEQGVEIEILEGSDITEAYEGRVGGDSCMTSRPDNIELYELNPDKVKLATAHIGDTSARCLLWYTDDGHVVQDRVYSCGLRTGGFTSAIAKHFEDTDLKFVPNRGEGRTFYVSNLTLPDSKMIPYLDTTMWKETGDYTIDIGINPTGTGWECQHDYELGGRLANPEEQCDCCGEYYNPEDDDSGCLESGDSFCGGCYRDGTVHWVEGRDGYFHQDDTRYSEWVAGYIHMDDAICTPDGEYVHTDDLEEWVQENVVKGNCSSSWPSDQYQSLVDTIVQSIMENQ